MRTLRQAGTTDLLCPSNHLLSEWFGAFLTSDVVSALGVEPDIVPTFQGGLPIEWHTDAVDLIIESAPSAEGSFYFSDNETGEEVEAALGDRIDAITAAFRKLGRRS